MIRSLRVSLVFPLILLLSLSLASCGGSGGGSDDGGSTGSGSDTFVISLDGGLPTTYTETGSITVPGGYDPRIDSYVASCLTFNCTSIILESDYDGGSSFNEILIMIIEGDSIGDYTIGVTQASYLLNGTSYSASIVYPASSGTISITTYDDDRIQGTFDITLVDAADNPLHISGSFDLEPGITL